MSAPPLKRKKRRTAAKPAETKPGRTLNPSDATDPGAPLYRKLVQALKDEILGGRYPVGTQLPTEGELRQRFEVSRHTVREALRQLRDDGLVTSRQGSGTTVRTLGSQQPYVHEIAAIDDLVAYASGTQYRADSSNLVVADAEMAARIGGKVGQRWLCIEGYRYAPKEKLPICWTQVYVHGSFAGVGLLLGRRSGPIYGWIEEQYGERIAEVEQTLRARQVPAEIVATLELDDASTVVEVQRVYRLASGTVAEVAFSLYPAERFSFSMTLRRARR